VVIAGWAELEIEERSFVAALLWMTAKRGTRCSEHSIELLQNLTSF
jgi:hypothetical protein